jgi:hypothetical protein
MLMTEDNIKEAMHRFAEGPLFIVEHTGNDMEGHSSEDTFNYRGKTAYEVWERIKEEEFEGAVSDLDISEIETTLIVSGSDNCGSWAFTYKITLADFVSEAQSEGLKAFEELGELLKGEATNIIGPVIDHHERVEMEVHFTDKKIKLLWNGGTRKITYKIELYTEGDMPATPQKLSDKVKGICSYVDLICQ